MNKTGAEIESDIFNMISGSELEEFVNGSAYKKGVRPFGSALEDIVVGFSAGIDGQRQTGAIDVNIYVPNIDAGSEDGRKVPDKSRIEAVEKKARTFFDSLISTEYDFPKAATIQSFEAEGLEQFYVSIKIKYRRITI